MPDHDPAVREIILAEIRELRKELKEMNEKIVVMDKKIAYFAGFFTAAGSVATLLGHKVYAYLFGS